MSLYEHIPPCLCAWCTLPIVSDDIKTLQRLTYHSVCFDQFENWFRANAHKLADQKRILDCQEITYDPTTHEWRECDGE